MVKERYGLYSKYLQYKWYLRKVYAFVFLLSFFKAGK